MVKVQQENEQLKELNERLKADYDKARKVIMELCSFNTKKRCGKYRILIAGSCLITKFG